MDIFAAVAIALYVGHHVGDYWVQTDHQARHKGDAGHLGRVQCLLHVFSYTATQSVMLGAAGTVLGLPWPGLGPVTAGLAISAVTHYLADRREHGLMFWLARRLPGKAAFLKLGVPRQGVMVTAWQSGQRRDDLPDNPSLGTGAWALNQSWHLFWGVFVAALVIAA